MPFSNLILLDSPLTTFEEKKNVGTGNKNMAIQTAFFTDLSKTSKNCQIIILDNKMPEKSLWKELNVQFFTGVKGLDRTGFFQSI